ncbi:MAG: (Fe-S)-binding protein [Pseudomonadota bacterium]
MATRSGLLKWFPEFYEKHNAYTVFDLLKEYISSGRIKLDRSVITEKVAYHDPCNYGRKSLEAFGQAYFEEPRWILDQFVDNWVDLSPNRENGYCCGGGGGTMLTPYTDERFLYGAKKTDQIRRTGAELVVVPCHSCHGQIKASLAKDGLDIPVKYLWEIVAEAMILD